MPKKLDLTNQEFGLIRCISPAKSSSGKTYWNCECVKCGAKKVIQTAHIRNGSIRSCDCGCLEKTLNYASTLEKECKICGKKFIPIRHGAKRICCFDCEPEGLEHSKKVLLKRQALKKQGVYLLGGKCEKCGETRPYVLAFHHLNGEEKDFTPSRLIANSNIDDFFKEIKKCILLCNNCHSEFHYLEANNKITIQDYLNNNIEI